MYKRIRRYFIKKKIRKLNEQIQCIKEKIVWLKEHLHDFNIADITKQISILTREIEINNMYLNSYKEDLERFK